ncbi:hypothetical protein [Riemerella columbina]|uniref:hypothetical protein n=1 Tax=Riemerella columbina TaxID=103810 RepID=UPI00266FA3BD|nr:hypothetical protein [Riemerella columbina]WKS95625.1 hypothetical protein NYR17_02470 [Riemerella columbina]
MNKKIVLKNLQLIFSVLTLICLVIGWVKPFSEAVNDLLRNQVFYIFMGITFMLVGLQYKKPLLRYWIVISGVLVVVGKLLPSVPYLTAVGLLCCIIPSFIFRNKTHQI